MINEGLDLAGFCVCDAKTLFDEGLADVLFQVFDGLLGTVEESVDVLYEKYCEML
jgi:hypothetical protein